MQLASIWVMRLLNGKWGIAWAQSKTNPARPILLSLDMRDRSGEARGLQYRSLDDLLFNFYF